MSTKEILKQAKRLSPDKRTVLAHQIWASVEEECGSRELTAAQRQELERRIEYMTKHPDQWSSLEEVLGRIKAKPRK